MRVFFFFENSSSLVFALCCLPSATRSSKKIMSRGARFQGFWDLLAHFAIQGARNLGFGMRHKIAEFYHVLSVSVVPLVSVESAMECQMTCLMKCFLRCVFERYDAVCHVSPPWAATQAFSLRTQALPIFSKISRLPAHVLSRYRPAHRSLKCCATAKSLGVTG